MNSYIESFKQLWLYSSIKQQILQNSFSHSHMFVCEDIFSAKIFSRLVAFSLICDNKDACLTCPSCLKAKAETHPDLYVLPKEKTFLVASASFIIENAYKKPIISENQVFLIDDFDKAGVSAQNKILKILEEPPKNTFFILNISNEKKVLSTISSRVQKHFVPPFEKNQLRTILRQNQISFTENVLQMSEGYLGKALGFTQNKDFLQSYDFVINVLTQMLSSKDIIKYSSILSDKNTFLLKLEIFERVFRNLLVLKNQGQALLDDAEILMISALENEFSTNAILSILNRLIKAKMLFDASVNLTSITDNLLLGILEDKFLWK